MANSKTILLTGIVVLAMSVICAASERKIAPNPSPHRSSVPLQSRHKILSAQPLVIGYYLEDSRALRSIEENADRMTVIAPQTFIVEADGVVQGSVPPALAALARRKNLPIMPLVVNPGFDRRIISTILGSAHLQERFASYLAHLAWRGDFAGWQLDLEHIDPADKDRYSSFVRRLAAKLHRDGRILSVAVTPRFSDSFPDTRDAPYRTGEWGAPFDYRALAESADFIVLMAYDQHTSATPPGPVAGYDWVRTALDYAVSHIPPHKLVLGIPLYGREWVETAFGRISRSMDFDALTSLLGQPDIREQWHDMWRTPWIQYREKPDTHTVWFENRRSIEEKLRLVRSLDLRGIAVWRIGLENPEFWTVTSEWSGGKSNRAENAVETRPKRRRVSGGSSQ